MKKLAIIISLLIPTLSFAGTPSYSTSTEVFLEQCAKEKDPVKRQNSCHMLDQHGESQATIPDFHKEIITV